MTVEKITYTVAEAAASTGLSQRTITDAHDRGDLIGHWSGSKRLFFPADLAEWVKALPTVKPERRAS